MNEYILSEDLAVWFGKKKKKKGSSQPKGPWVNICKKKKGGGHPPCGRESTDKGGYPVCRGAGVAGKMSQAEKDSACRRKREKEKKDTQTGKGQKPNHIKIKNYKKESVDTNLIQNILKEYVETKNVISEDLLYHIEYNIPINENVFRRGSEKYFSIINEARKLKKLGYYNREEDNEILESDLGKFFIYKGEKLPFDFPMINENDDSVDKYSALIGFITLVSDSGGSDKSVDEMGGLVELRMYYENLRDGKTPKTLSNVGKAAQRAIDSQFNRWIEENPNKFQTLVNMGSGVKSKNLASLTETEYKGKKVELGKPKKGGSKKYYVYVRNPKTNKVIKVSYGSPDMSANWNDPEARKSFAARHQCDKKKDRTKAGYWACRAHKDFGKNVPGRFW